MLSVMSEWLYLQVEHTSPKVTITSGKINTFFKPRLTNLTLATVNIYHFLRLVLEKLQNAVYTTGILNAMNESINEMIQKHTKLLLFLF